MKQKLLLHTVMNVMTKLMPNENDAGLITETSFAGFVVAYEALQKLISTYSCLLKSFSENMHIFLYVGDRVLKKKRN